MFWFSLAILGYLLLAVVFVLDKFILEKSVPKPALYTFYSTIFMLPLFFLLPFGKETLSLADWGIAAISGVSFGCALWTLFIALIHGEATHITPFNGAIISIATFIGGALFLEERLNTFQLTGILLLIIASLLFAYEKTERKHRIHHGFVWAVFSGILFALSHVSAKYIYAEYDFLTGFVSTKATIGLVGVCTLLLPSVRQALSGKQPKPKQKKEKKVGVVPLVVIINKLLSVISILLIQYAIYLGSVTVVNALSGVQYVGVFLIMYFLSVMSPHILKEYFTRKEIVVEVCALLLVLAGSALLVITL